ncbi:MAG: hypothetical protein ACFE89_09115 [Candidatus Hodarchaeota archaeon]
MVRIQWIEKTDNQYQEGPTVDETPPLSGLTQYEKPKGLGDSLLYTIGAIGLFIWAFALWAYEIYQWVVIPSSFSSWITGMALISFTIGLGATLAGLTGYAYWQDSNESIGLYGFLLGILLGWILFASDLLDFLQGSATLLGGLVWIVGYIVMGILLFVWALLGEKMLKEIETSQGRTSAGRWITIIGGFAYIGWIFFDLLALVLFIAPVGLIIFAIALWGMK